MKTSLKFTTVVTLLFLAVVGMAREPKMNLVPANNSKGVVLTMEEAPNSTTITLLDSNEYIIYSEKLSENSRGKRIDMENLNDGTYYFKTEHDLKTITYTIEIMGNEVTIVNRDEKVKPYFRKENKKVFMNFLNLDKSKVLIKVYDENRLVFTETISEELIIEKAFNFEGAYGGNYVLIVEDNNEIYSEELVVK